MMRTKRNTQRGFSLIELLIVVAIMLVIAAIAIPAFYKAKRAANESTAVQTLKSIASAQATYSTQYDNGYGSATQLANVGESCDTAGLLPLDLMGLTGGSGVTQGGYVFTMTNNSPLPTARTGCAAAGSAGWTAVAVPVVINQTGIRGFFIDQSGTVRYTTTGAPPNLGSTVLGQ